MQEIRPIRGKCDGTPATAPALLQEEDEPPDSGRRPDQTSPVTLSPCRFAPPSLSAETEKIPERHISRAASPGSQCEGTFPVNGQATNTFRSWLSWKWQIKNRLRTLESLERTFPGFSVGEGMRQAVGRFPMAITPYYASLMETLDERDPIFRMAVPLEGELHDPLFLADDPLEEDHDMPVPGLVHRYQDRALLIATSMCAMYCRHCTRKRVAGHRETTISTARLERAVKYLREHPEIHDVVISGGDPLTMATDVLEKIIAAVRSVPTVEVIRIGTRTPVTLPMRITDRLVTMLRRYEPLWVNTHFNHPREITPESREACRRLVDGGIPVGNQSVLLRGVNDDPDVMSSLLRKLVQMRVRPYYLFQCDLVRGVEHFRTPLSRGIQIMEYLRGRLSGFAIPTFVVDAPGGGGKIPVLPTYVVSQSPTHTVLRNFEGMLVSYPEPLAHYGQGRVDMPSAADAPTVYELGRGDAVKIEPATTLRGRRRSAQH